MPVAGVASQEKSSIHGRRSAYAFREGPRVDCKGPEGQNEKATAVLLGKPGLEPRGESYHFQVGGLFADRLRLFLAHPRAGCAPHPHIVHQNGALRDGEAEFLPIPGRGAGTASGLVLAPQREGCVE